MMFDFEVNLDEPEDITITMQEKEGKVKFIATNVPTTIGQM
jgi:hypothetical protein